MATSQKQISIEEAVVIGIEYATERLSVLRTAYVAHPDIDKTISDIDMMKNAVVDKLQHIANDDINNAIVVRTLPMLYDLIDQLLSAGGTPSKQLVVAAKRALPKQYVNSFEHPKEK